MGKNYEALHYIQKQMSGYDASLSNAIQRLFNIEDQCHEAQGCLIDSVVSALLFKKYGIDVTVHLGEMCADGKHDCYHCWLTIDGKLFDFGVYGNSNYNPFYHGPKLTHPLIFEEKEEIKYVDGSTETHSWLAGFQEMPFTEYIRKCPQNRATKLFCNALDIAINEDNQNMIFELAKDMKFPPLKHIEESPSGRRGA